MKGIIYKLTNLDNGEAYIGSTTNTLAGRIASGHTICGKDHWDNYKREVLETIEVLDGNRSELRKLEQKYMNEYEGILVNIMKAQGPLDKNGKVNHELSRSPNSEFCDPKKLEMKRQNRRDHYNRKKNDEEYQIKLRETNKLRMREKRAKLKTNKDKEQDSVSETERLCA